MAIYRKKTAELTTLLVVLAKTKALIGWPGGSCTQGGR